MKKVLEIVKLFELPGSRLEDLLKKSIIQGHVASLCNYRDSLKYLSSQNDITFHQIYVNNFVEVVGALYEHYELDSSYFNVLDMSVKNLIRSIEAQKKETKDQDEIKALQTLEAESYEKATMIYQTAADKTEEKYYQTAYSSKAKEYCQKADAVHQCIQKPNYFERMSQLYQRESKKCPVAFLGDYLKKRGEEYTAKFKKDIFQTSSSSSSSLSDSNHIGEPKVS